MPTTHSLALFIGAALVLLLIPGPAVVYVVTRSASQGRRAGMVSVLGIHVGTAVHVVAAVLGLSALIVASATAFSVVKYAGAAYLVYLGIRSLRQFRHTPSTSTAPAMPSRSMRRVFTDGVVVNLLNPKTAVFFLAFVPQFVDMQVGNSTGQLLVLSALFILLGIATDGAYALAGSWIGVRLADSPTLARRRELVAGTTYIGLGLVTAFAGGGNKQT